MARKVWREFKCDNGEKSMASFSAKKPRISPYFSRHCHTLNFLAILFSPLSHFEHSRHTFLAIVTVRKPKITFSKIIHYHTFPTFLLWFCCIYHSRNFIVKVQTSVFRNTKKKNAFTEFAALFSFKSVCYAKYNRQKSFDNC